MKKRGKKKADKDRQYVGFNVDPEHWIALKIKAAKEHTTMRQLINEAIASYLKGDCKGGDR